MIHYDFEIEDLGITDEFVYDIEVEDNHNFFANDILVHNSLYLCVEPFVELKCKDDDLPTKIEKIDQFLKKIVQPKLRDHLDN